MKLVKMSLLAAAALVVMTIARPALAGSIMCTVAEVMVFQPGPPGAANTNRVHIKCSNTVVDGANTVMYFAVPATDKDYSNRLVTLGTTALTAGRPLLIAFANGKTTDPNNVNFGCDISNCRYPDWMALQ